MAGIQSSEIFFFTGIDNLVQHVPELGLFSRVLHGFRCRNRSTTAEQEGNQRQALMEFGHSVLRIITRNWKQAPAFSVVVQFEIPISSMRRLFARKLAANENARKQAHS
jgi:hypothetical protein